MIYLKRKVLQAFETFQGLHVSTPLTSTNDYGETHGIFENLSLELQFSRLIDGVQYAGPTQLRSHA